MIGLGLPAVLLAAMSSAAVGATERPPVAVFDIEPHDLPSFTQERMRKFSDLLDGEVTRSGYQTVPRSALHARIKDEKAESYRPCYDEACQIELGKAVAASKALSSSWTRFGEACVLNAKFYDLKTELAELSLKADAACDDNGLRQAIEQIGSGLRSRGLGEYGDFRVDLDEAAAIKNPPADTSGYLRISASAQGKPNEPIEVYINGEQRGTVAGGVFAKELSVGRYIVLLRTAGGLFAHRRFELEMTKDGVRIPKNGTIELVSVFGSVQIQGTPPVATALINGDPRPINRTLREQLRAGEYQVVVEAPGFLASAPQQVLVAAGDVVSVSYQLTRNAGAVAISGTPEGADIVLDGESVGRVPASLRDVQVGDHIVDIIAKGHHPQRLVAKVEIQKTVELSVALTAKKARLKVEAVTKVAGEEGAAVEADLYVDDRRVGSTPWKGEVLGDVPLKLSLRMGTEVGPVKAVKVLEGQELREVIEVPASWGGPVSTLRFDLVPGPWVVRSGASELDPGRPNPVRPGRLQVDLLLGDRKAGQAEINISPNETRTLIVTDRPKTPDELEASRTFWMWRKWISLGATATAALVGGYGLIAAHRAEDARDQAWSGLRVATVPEEMDAYRMAVVDEDGARADAQNLASFFLTGAAVLGAWSLVEWIWAEPTIGELKGDGFEPVIVEEGS